jgi:hypothetical protein
MRFVVEDLGPVFFGPLNPFLDWNMFWICLDENSVWIYLLERG